MLPSFLANFIYPVFGAVAGTPCNLSAHSFFFFPPWWEYIPAQINDLGACSPHYVFPSSIWLIALALIDMLMRLAGFLAILSIFIASIEYIIAIGNPEKITNARKRIINSLVGVAIAFSAVAVVTFAGKALGG